jgi:hypothetical protein
MRAALLTDQIAAKGVERKEDDGFLIEAEMGGSSAKELNRTLFYALEKIAKLTTLRAEWTSGDTTERYFDYVLKKTVKGLTPIGAKATALFIQDVVVTASIQPSPCGFIRLS